MPRPAESHRNRNAKLPNIEFLFFYDSFEKRFLATGAGHTSSCTALRIIAVRIPFRNGTHKFGAVGGGKYASWRRERGTSTAFRTIEYYCGKNSFPPSHLYIWDRNQGCPQRGPSIPKGRCICRRSPTVESRWRTAQRYQTTILLLLKRTDSKGLRRDLTKFCSFDQVLIFWQSCTENRGFLKE